MVGFSGYPLDRAPHLREDAAACEAARLGATAQLILFHGLRPLMALDQPMALRLAGDARDLLAGRDAQTVFLGLGADGAAVFAAAARSDAVAGSGGPIAGLGDFVELRQAAMEGLGGSELALLGAARALLDWHQRHRFCANCGQPSASTLGGWKRRCPACEAEHFPRVDPVAIMLPVLGERCCLGRQPRFPRGMFSALAGFLEPGETIEECCAREVKEEVGLTVRGFTHVATQPWPFPAQLMVGMIAEVTDDNTTLDPTEIDEVVWLTRPQARAALNGGVELDGRRIWSPPPFAIANRLLTHWVGG